MEYCTVVTPEFQQWFSSLTISEQIDVRASVLLLQKLGPTLPFPYSSSVEGSAHSHMRELRIQHKGKPYRALYAFDPERSALLIIGGDKTGNKRWYKTHIPIADKLYTRHLEWLKQNQPKGRSHGTHPF